MVNRGVWRPVSQVLVILLVLQVIVTGALRREDVRRDLRWWVAATPTLGGRRLVVLVQPVSGVQQGNGSAMLASEALQEKYALRYPVPTALHVIIWGQAPVRRTAGRLGDVMVSLDVLTMLPLVLQVMALVLVLWLAHARVKRAQRDTPSTSCAVGTSRDATW
jgi:hypothetical protein